ncbi:MAG: hypothetical protein EPN82_01535 [Bacteroidetes bacterium]|nr:MAG: hypothetical protein EPN82_01535 [Bacteroidota bacterium]
MLNVGKIIQQRRVIFVRKPIDGESNSNNLLIEKGAVPVDMNGNKISNTKIEQKQTSYSKEEHQMAMIFDKKEEYK